MSGAARPSSRRWLAAAQIALSIIMLGLLVAFVDFEGLAARFAAAEPAWMALGIGIGVVQIVALGLRWWQLNTRLHLAQDIGAVRHVALSGLTQSASQVLPSSIGGDAVRVIALKRLGMALAPAMLSVGMDRVAGLMGLIGLVLFALALGGVPRGAEDAAMAAAITAVASVLLILLGPWIAARPRIVALATRLGVERALAATSRLLRDPLAALALLAMSIVPHALNVAMAWCAARALGLDVGWDILLIAVPLALLVMTLPISVAGWGVREAVLIFALGLGGIAAHDALAVSVTWGALLLALGILALAPSLYVLTRR